MRQRGNVTSQHQQNIQREDQSEETSDTPGPGDISNFCVSVPPFLKKYGPAVVLLALWINQVCCQGNKIN